MNRSILHRHQWAIAPFGISQLIDIPEAVQNHINALDSSQIHSPASDKADEDYTKFFRDFLSIFFNQRQEMKVEDGIAMIHAKGAMLYDAAPFDLGLGATGYEEIIADIEAANAQGVDKIALYMDSPGGTVTGIKEVVQAMEQSEAPIFCHIDGIGCSAGYYIASSAEMILASPTATVGNIGTVLHWADLSAYYEAMGVKFETLTNEGADLKGTFYEMPVQGEQRKFLQDGVNEMGEEFWEHVNSQRDGLDPELKKAGWYSGDKAGEMGLIDGIATKAEFNEYIKSL